MKSHDLTKGGLAKTLLTFTLPFMLANLLQALYGLADTFVIGRFADSAALAAVTLGSTIMAMINVLITGFTLGGTVLIGQYLGAKREKDAKETISTMFTLYSILAVGLTVVMLFLAAPILRLINTPAEAFDGALAYLRICFAGIFFTFGYNGLSAALRGMGDSKSPLLFIAIACTVNIVGDVILVGAFGMGPAGAAIATASSQAISMFIGIAYLRKRNFTFDFHLKSFRIIPEKARHILKLGVPMGLQESLVLLSFVIIAAIINNIGYIAVAAAGILDKIFMVAVIPASAFSGSIAAMVAQNIGAGQTERARKCLMIGACFGFVVSAVFFAIMKLFPDAMIRTFTRDSRVVAAACEYLVFYAYDFLLCGLVFPMIGFLNGCGRSRLTMNINIISTFLIRVPVCYLANYLAGGHSLYHLGIGLPIATLIQILMALFFILRGNMGGSAITDARPVMEK